MVLKVPTVKMAPKVSLVNMDLRAERVQMERLVLRDPEELQA